MCVLGVGSEFTFRFATYRWCVCVYELRLCEWALVGGNVRVWDPGSGTRPPRQPQYVRVEGAGVWGLHRMKPDVEVLVVRLGSVFC